jgi:hypothetical protein
MVYDTQGAILSVEQFKIVWGLCIEDRSVGEVRDEASLLIRWAATDLRYWNALANFEAGAGIESLKATLGRAVRYLRARAESGYLLMFEDLLAPEARAGLPRMAEAAGLSHALSGCGMAGDILPLAEEPTHPELAFRRVRNDADTMAFAEIYGRASDYPVESAHAGFAGSKLWTDTMFAYLGLKDGQPVTAAATVRAGDCLYVIHVATLPDHHRRGYGEAVTRKALYEGALATGLRRATLHSPMRSVPVYERIGLKATASIQVYGLTA